MSAASEDDVRQRVTELLGRIKDPGCPVRLPPTNILLEVTFDLRGLAAGQARMKRVNDGKRVVLRFNPAAMGFENGKFILDEVVPHEVAHVFSYLIASNPALPKKMRAPFAGHGHGWQMLARWLGASGKRTCDVGLKPSRDMRPFTYKASCGTEIKVTARVHAKLQSGARMGIRNTGGRLTAAHFVSQGGTQGGAS
jgi:predicted SprT family Zn-dependent metalloprotease